jgi:hypothetical protein
MFHDFPYFPSYKPPFIVVFFMFFPIYSGIFLSFPRLFQGKYLATRISHAFTHGSSSGGSARGSGAPVSAWIWVKMEDLGDHRWKSPYY